MNDLLPAVRYEFERYKEMADAAIATLDDALLFEAPASQSNSVALVIKHVGGNLRSRWTDFLASDGEKPDRLRDSEFVIGDDNSREALLARWETGWAALFATLETLDAAALAVTVTIRGETHTVVEATLRSLSHTAYHVGQITYLARMLRPDAPWLTIPPGKSGAARGQYLSKNDGPTR